jgi:dual specificity MAP kinase phosphatase
MKFITSFLLKLSIQAQRFIDHTHRKLTGLPQLKRSQITHELFLGGQYGIRAIATMQKIGITGIINMRTRSLNDKKFAEYFEILNLPTPDFQAPTLDHLQQGVAFIKAQVEQSGKIYIHCRLGEGRGPSMVIAYLLARGMTYEDALATVKKVRPFIGLSKAQVNRLKEFERLANHS